MAKPGKADVDRSELLFDEFLAHPEIGREYSQTFSKILGWDRTNETWKFLSVDSNGNIGLSSSVSGGQNLAVTKLVVGAAAVLVMPVNNARKEFTIRNTGYSPIWLGSSIAVTIVSGYLLSPYEVIASDKFLGALYAIASGAARTADLWEVT